MREFPTKLLPSLQIVGMADCFLLVTPVAAIVARDPRTGSSISKPPIAEVEAAFGRDDLEAVFLHLAERAAEQAAEERL